MTMSLCETYIIFNIFCCLEFNNGYLIYENGRLETMKDGFLMVRVLFNNSILHKEKLIE